MKRDANIELWRIVCMFAIVLFHVLKVNKIGQMTGTMWHVPGFLLISGYFGLDFNWRKILKLLGIVYGCYWLTIPFRWGEDTLLSLVLPHGAWFLPFYLVLMLISPIFNSALSNEKYSKRMMLIIVALLFIGWFPTLSNNQHFRMMLIPGLQGNGILLMIGTYFIGHFLARYKFSDVGSWLVWILAFVGGVISMSSPLFAPLYKNGYASPFTLLVAACGFIFCLHLPRNMGKVHEVICFISPSMFGVYILHHCCLHKYQTIRGEGLIDAIIRSLLLFLGCICIDIIRRFMVYLISLGKRKYLRIGRCLECLVTPEP